MKVTISASFLACIGLMSAAPTKYDGLIESDFSLQPTGCMWYRDVNVPYKSLLNCTGLGLTKIPNKFSSRRAGAIHFDNNNLKVIDKDTFDGLSELFMLFLDHNKISLIVDNAFGAMTLLEVLSLRGNLLSKFPIGLQPLVQLQLVDLSDNKIATLETDNGIAPYGGNVRWLNLNNNNVNTIKCGFFLNGGRLNYLSMKANPSKCEVEWQTGNIGCECANALYVGAAGYCDGRCNAKLGAPRNVIGASQLYLNYSWERVSSMLSEHESIPQLRVNDGTHVDINKKTRTDDSSNDGSGLPTVTIAVCVCVSTLAVIGAVVGMKKLQNLKVNHPTDGSSISDSKGRSEKDTESDISSRGGTSKLY